MSFVNLETSLARGGQPIPGRAYGSGLTQFASELKKAGVDVVTLANNHVLDYDEPALVETLAALRESSVAVCGGGLNIDEAHARGHQRRRSQYCVPGLLELADIFWTYSYPRSFRAQKARPGVAPMDEKMIVQDIRKARALADHVVVSFHWGEEYVRTPNPKQVGLAHIAIDAGSQCRSGPPSSCAPAR